MDQDPRKEGSEGRSVQRLRAVLRRRPRRSRCARTEPEGEGEAERLGRGLQRRPRAAWGAGVQLHPAGCGFTARGSSSKSAGNREEAAPAQREEHVRGKVICCTDLPTCQLTTSGLKLSC